MHRVRQKYQSAEDYTKVGKPVTASMADPAGRLLLPKRNSCSCGGGQHQAALSVTRQLATMVLFSTLLFSAKPEVLSLITVDIINNYELWPAFTYYELWSSPSIEK